MKHEIKVNTQAYRVDWPMYKMAVGDFINLKGDEAENMRRRAMSVASHYRKTRGFIFRSQKIHSRQYIVWRES